jgi:hypothetical protein
MIVVVLNFLSFGLRSLAAAEALQEAGFRHLVNIVEGFEGDLDVHKHRGKFYFGAHINHHSFRISLH